MLSSANSNKDKEIPGAGVGFYDHEETESNKSHLVIHFDQDTSIDRDISFEKWLCDQGIELDGDTVYSPILILNDHREIPIPSECLNWAWTELCDEFKFELSNISQLECRELKPEKESFSFICKGKGVISDTIRGRNPSEISIGNLSPAAGGYIHAQNFDIPPGNFNKRGKWIIKYPLKSKTDKTEMRGDPKLDKAWDKILKGLVEGKFGEVKYLL